MRVVYQGDSLLGGGFFHRGVARGGCVVACKKCWGLTVHRGER
jgi:hypothetical protein